MAEQRLRTNRRATLEVLSPLHVGSGGGPLIPDYDVAFERGTAWVMDPRKVLERFDDAELRHGIPEVRLSKVVGPDGYADCAAYSLPASGVEAREILPALKDVEGRPYVPGSSLKGALRGVAGWAAAREEGGAPGPGELVNSPKYAGSRWERRIFGPSPNYDLMRCLLVDDTGPATLDRLELAVVSVFSLKAGRLEGKGPGYRFFVEALQPGTLLSCRVGVADQVLSRRELGLQERRGLIDRLAAHARARAAELIAGERAFYARCGPRPLQQFYERLEGLAAALGESQFLLQMSWGTGWNAKTLGTSLAGAPHFQEVRQRYRLGYAAAEFPKSRRLVERGGAAAEPLGWVKVSL